MFSLAVCKPPCWLADSSDILQLQHRSPSQPGHYPAWSLDLFKCAWPQLPLRENPKVQKSSWPHGDEHWSWILSPWGWQPTQTGCCLALAHLCCLFSSLWWAQLWVGGPASSTSKALHRKSPWAMQYSWRRRHQCLRTFHLSQSASGGYLASKEPGGCCFPGEREAQACSQPGGKSCPWQRCVGWWEADPIYQVWCLPPLQD